MSSDKESGSQNSMTKNILTVIEAIMPSFSDLLLIHDGVSPKAEQIENMDQFLIILINIYN